MPSPVARWVCPGPGRPEQDDVAGLGEEPARRECGDLLPHGWLGAPVELLDRLPRSEPRGPDPQLGAGGVAGCDLAVQHRGEVLLVGPSGVGGVICQSAGRFGDPGRLESHWV